MRSAPWYLFVVDRGLYHSAERTPEEFFEFVDRRVVETSGNNVSAKDPNAEGFLALYRGAVGSLRSQRVSSDIFQGLMKTWTMVVRVSRGGWIA